MPPRQIRGRALAPRAQWAQAREGADDLVAADLGVEHAAEHAEQEGDLPLGGLRLVRRRARRGLVGDSHVDPPLPRHGQREDEPARARRAPG